MPLSGRFLAGSPRYGWASWKARFSAVCTICSQRVQATQQPATVPCNRIDSGESLWFGLPDVERDARKRDRTKLGRNTPHRKGVGRGERGFSRIDSAV